MNNMNNIKDDMKKKHSQKKKSVGPCFVRYLSTSKQENNNNGVINSIYYSHPPMWLGSQILIDSCEQEQQQQNELEEQNEVQMKDKQSENVIEKDKEKQDVNNDQQLKIDNQQQFESSSQLSNQENEIRNKKSIQQKFDSPFVASQYSPFSPFSSFNNNSPELHSTQSQSTSSSTSQQQSSQSHPLICLVTGLPASYIDPILYLPFSSSKAQQFIRSLPYHNLAQLMIENGSAYLAGVMDLRDCICIQKMDIDSENEQNGQNTVEMKFIENALKNLEQYHIQSNLNEINKKDQKINQQKDEIEDARNEKIQFVNMKEVVMKQMTKIKRKREIQTKKESQRSNDNEESRLKNLKRRRLNNDVEEDIIMNEQSQIDENIDTFEERKDKDGINLTFPSLLTSPISVKKKQTNKRSQQQRSPISPSNIRSPRNSKQRDSNSQYLSPTINQSNQQRMKNNSNSIDQDQIQKSNFWNNLNPNDVIVISDDGSDSGEKQKRTTNGRKKQ